MSITRTLGGDRLGSGNKMQVELHGFERSTHDRSYLWRSTMSAGTLVPFMTQVAKPGDTFDIRLDCDIKTHPTIGPLFGTYKVQLDVFEIPMKLYNGLLHNNKVGIGLQMNRAYLPKMKFYAKNYDVSARPDPDNTQINPSSILAHLGLRGIGNNPGLGGPQARSFNATSLLAYWEVVKQYYANKMEDNAMVIHSTATIGFPVDEIHVITPTTDDIIPPYPIGPTPPVALGVNPVTYITIYGIGGQPNLDFVMFYFSGNQGTGFIPATSLGENWEWDAIAGAWTGNYNFSVYGQGTVAGWRPADETDTLAVEPEIVGFPLSNIDLMREALMANSTLAQAVQIGDFDLEPYSYIIDTNATTGYKGAVRTRSQEGLAVKTYQSDLFNNWVNTEYIDGPTGINAITAIDTSGGSINIDTIILSKKVYDMLNRIAVSGGTYNDWIQVNYDTKKLQSFDNPAYRGGLIKELAFQEVVANTASAENPQGQLSGRGVLTQKHKGGHVIINVDEHAYIMGIISLTPRVDYSQGNAWDLHLDNLDEIHKPGMDQIGFQSLLAEQLAWWTTEYTGGEWVQKEVGKQPAWMNYMTNVNVVRGNFAIGGGEPVGEMFMTLNRRYEIEEGAAEIADLTTYIDPSKYNFIFAETAIDAQNFWAQIAVNIEYRGKMSAKIMPNL